MPVQYCTTQLFIRLLTASLKHTKFLPSCHALHCFYTLVVASFFSQTSYLGTTNAGKSDVPHF